MTHGNPKELFRLRIESQATNVPLPWLGALEIPSGDATLNNFKVNYPRRFLIRNHNCVCRFFSHVYICQQAYKQQLVYIVALFHEQNIRD